MSKIIDLTGQRFNHWTVISRVKNNSRGETMWECLCDCGNKKIVQGYSLRKGLSKSCGCLQKQKASEANFENLVGQKFGHLTVKELKGRDNSKKIIWTCECDCIAKNLVYVRTADLRNGKTTSCGCIKSLGEEKISILLKEANLNFVKEKTFPTCRFPDSNTLARFDFFVDDRYIIEYDGIQHYKVNGGWNTANNLIKTQNRDKFKNQWCKDNNIPIIRIKYDQLEALTIKELIL